MKKEDRRIIEARRWLNRGWSMEREIDALTDLKCEAFEQATSMTAAPDGIRVSGSQDPHKLDRLAELNGKIDRIIDEENAVKTEIIDLIRGIEDRRFRTILINRYTRYLTFEQIAVQLNYSWRQVIRLHRSALYAVAEILDEKMS